MTTVLVSGWASAHSGLTDPRDALTWANTHVKDDNSCGPVLVAGKVIFERVVPMTSRRYYVVDVVFHDSKTLKMSF